MSKMNAGQLHNALTWVEVSGEYAPDCRRVIRDERFTLAAAIQSGDPKKIASAMDEAYRVAEMWGVKL